MRLFLDEGLPVGPLTLRVEDGLVSEVDEGRLEGARPATPDESRSFWDRFWHRGPFVYGFDLSEISPFQAKVLECLAAEVAVGETVSYGELAFMAGRPRAWRAVGSAMARNPFPIFFPCHRVIRSGGNLGSYGFAGPGTKKRLLDWEAELVGHHR